MELAIAAGVLGLAFFLYGLSSGKASSAYAVFVDGEVVFSGSLGEDVEFILDERPNMVFVVRDGKAAVVSSDCPDKLCVKAGFIGAEGQSAVCLPNKTMIRILRNPETDAVDAVAGK